LANPAQYLSGWIILGLWKLDFGNGIKLGEFWENWENFGQLKDFWIFQFPP
jgi:hypothetical protein